MKAFAVRQKQRSCGLVDVPDPSIDSPTSVKIRILDVGVCGTDAEICSFAYGDPPTGGDFLVTGHEALGEVIEIGARVKGLRKGDLVVPSVRRPCPDDDCPACRSGAQDFCFTGNYTERGIKGAHGFLAERIVDEERYLTPVPRHLRDVAVLTEPLTVAEKGLQQYVDVQRRLPWQEDASDEDLMRGRTAVVLGAGPVGLLGAMLLVRRGFAVTVYSRERAPNREAELLGPVGAAYVSSEETPIADLAKRLGRVDLVYEAAGASKFAFDVLANLGTNGVFIFTGVPGHAQDIELEGGTLMKSIVLKNQAAIGTVNAGPQAFVDAVKDLESFDELWPDSLRALITHRHPLAEFCKHAGERDGIKHVISVSDS